MTTVDLSQLLKNYADEQAEVLDEGTYQFEVTRCTVRNSNALFPIFKVIGGPDAGKTAMLGQLTLTEKAANIFFRNCKGFGFEPEYFASFPTVEEALKAVATQMQGRIVEIEVQKREWNGEDRNSFKPGRVKLVSMGTADGTPEGVPTQSPAPVAEAAPAPVAAAPATAAAPPPPPPAPAAGTAGAPPF